MFKKIFLVVVILFSLPWIALELKNKTEGPLVTTDNSYWLILHRKSNKEFLYQGAPGKIDNSRLLKVFQVKSGVPRVSPTPLHDLLGRKYWIINKKEPSDSPETAPYFLTLDIPSGMEWPYGPESYQECGGQCDWAIPGYFGLHGVSGDPSRLSENNPGSSGCVRHRDEDISYLYKILTPEKEEVRYYIKDI